MYVWVYVWDDGGYDRGGTFWSSYLRPTRLLKWGTTEYREYRGIPVGLYIFTLDENLGRGVAHLDEPTKNSHSKPTSGGLVEFLR